MTNVEALKNLYVALGGMIDDVEDFNLSVEVINAIAGIAGSGGDGGVLVVHINLGTGMLDKTWKEINDAIPSGAVIAIPDLHGGITIQPIHTSVMTLSGEYQIFAYKYGDGQSRIFTAATENDYPVST